MRIQTRINEDNTTEIYHKFLEEKSESLNFSIPITPVKTKDFLGDLFFLTHCSAFAERAFYMGILEQFYIVNRFPLVHINRLLVSVAQLLFCTDYSNQ